MRLPSPLLSCALSCAAVLATACGPTQGALDKVDDARARNDGPAIWMASDEDSTVYLFGTIHLMPPGLDWQRGDMLDAFAQSGTALFEAPSTDAARLTAQRLTAQRGYLGISERLSEGFDSYETKLLEVAALEADIPLEVLDSMRPWLASEVLLVAAAQRADLSAELGADEALKSLARRQGKNILYLDTVESQIALSADAPAAEQRTALRDTLEAWPRLASALSAIADAWVTGDLDTLEELSSGPMSAVVRERVLEARNALWAARIAELMEGSGTAFVAVGAGHLVGEGSLQAKLGELGIETERYLAFQGDDVIRTIDLRDDMNSGDPEL